MSKATARTSQKAKRTQYPLLVGFKETVLGKGFVAGVDLYGRAVAEEEATDCWWIYGVTPGALAGTGSTLLLAVTDFQERLKSVLVDFAEETESFDAFKAEVEAFFGATDEDALKEWLSARKAVKAGRLDLPGLSKDTSKGAPRLAVRSLKLEPSANLLDGSRSSLAA